MKKKQLYQPFELKVSGLDDWKEDVLVYHFFEIVHILEGDGVREVNENIFHYKQGDIFLFTPLDCRGFKSNSATKFYSIRFSKVFLTQYKDGGERERILTWVTQLEQMFYQHNRYEAVVLNDESDCELVSDVMRGMVTEYNKKTSYHEDNLQHLVTVLLNVLVRNVTNGLKNPVTAHEQEPLINQLLAYISEHIASKEKLKVRELAAKFHLSKTYVGEYFKKMTGESLQRYITVYRMKLVKHRLTHSGWSISEIVFEFGFTDSSHLTREFKKYYGQTPLYFRRNKGELHTSML